MKAVVVTPAMMNKTGSEPSRKFSNRGGSNGDDFVASRAPEVNATGRPTS
jgi:hypothetical protein